MKAANVPRAALLVAVCDEQTNAEIVYQARRSLSRKSGRLNAIAAVTSRELQDRLREFSRHMEDPEKFSVRFFDLEDLAARTLVTHCPAFSLDPTDQDRDYTLLVEGDDSFFDGFLRTIARRWFVRNPFDDRVLTLVPWTEGTAEAIRAAVERDPLLFSKVAIAPPPAAGDAPASPDVAYVLSPDPAEATSTAVELLDRLPETSRIVVRHGRDAGLARVFEQGDRNECGRVRVFSAYEDTCGDPDLILGSRYESLAQRLHALYLSENGLSEPTWDALEETFRDANRDQAEWIHRTLQDSGFGVRLQPAGRPEPPLVLSPQEVERMSRVEHRR